MRFQKGIPVPETQRTKAYIFREMEVGDSFLVPAEEAHAWRNAMHKASETGEFYFISRTVEGGVRFWRKS